LTYVLEIGLDHTPARIPVVGRNRKSSKRLEEPGVREALVGVEVPILKIGVLLDVLSNASNNDIDPLVWVFWFTIWYCA
jgi:hypothetical protein